MVFPSFETSDTLQSENDSTRSLRKCKRSKDDVEVAILHHLLSAAERHSSRQNDVSDLITLANM